MRRTFERNKWLIESIGLPIRPGLTPVAGVTGEAERDFVMAQVLSALVRIAAARSRRAQQRQPQRLVVRLVRSVLAIRKQRHAVRSLPGGEIDPLVGSNFELPLIFIRSLDGADVPVVGRHSIRRGERKSGFQ